MDDESVNLYDDSTDGTDDTGEDVSVEDGTGSGTDIPDTPPASDDLESLITGILDGYFSQDGNDIPGTDDVTGTETGDGTETETGTGMDETGAESVDKTGMEPGNETGMDGVESVEGENPDTGILSEMNETLHIHTENVQSFFSDTVSGNSIVITPDEGTAALLAQGIEGQALIINDQLEILDRLDTTNASIMLLFVVLCFDMLHRFAKRIIRNLMKGDGKNGTNL